MLGLPRRAYRVCGRNCSARTSEEMEYSRLMLVFFLSRGAMKGGNTSDAREFIMRRHTKKQQQKIRQLRYQGESMIDSSRSDGHEQ